MDELSRRELLVTTAFSLATTTLSARDPLRSPKSDAFERVRSEFRLDPGVIHLSGLFLASHPRVVREAIEKIRTALDRNPVDYWHEKSQDHEAEVRKAAGAYLNADPKEIALVESTTMGLALILTALKVSPGDEILTTTHDHYSMNLSLDSLKSRSGATITRVSLYRELAAVTEEEIVDTITRAISDRTRYVSVTWVHSGTGLKLPIAKISKAIAFINQNRKETEKILLCVDGVHGLAVEDADMKAMGCDVFIAGTHKWLFGPRGTGIVWANAKAWDRIHPTIPTFSFGAIDTPGGRMSPGGFQAFEHRWALKQAFDFHLKLGKTTVTKRIHSLNTQLKEGLTRISAIKLVTPLAESLSAGIVCFEADGLTPDEVVSRLRKRKIVASTTPYATSYPRFTPGLLNSSLEIQRTLQILERELKRG